MSEIPEAAVEAVLGTQHIQDHLGGSIDADDVRSILEAAMPAIRQQIAEEIREAEKSLTHGWDEDGKFTRDGYFDTFENGTYHAAQIVEGDQE